MNSVLKICQERYDAQLPPLVSESAVEISRKEWIDNAVETLVDRRGDVQFKRRLHAPQGVTFKAFAAEVEQFAINSDSKSPCAIGEMVIAGLLGDRFLARDGAEDLMAVADPKEQLKIIARELVKDLADDALIAQAEDNEL
ncbi:hypothetical protein PSH70_18125 [Pseudomonas fluorescens]|uniref:hypothetical protein n=1 Tax=Pseudomonas fluorescens TaxID=294 RepID=UPI002733A30A|nr:hypothetical protein [Pseudomonas fluorescens]WLH71898.1 hypothetical protein PSH70_18125 [Pseudomonas fluorescens]